MPSEQQIQNKIKTYLENRKAYVVKVIQASKSGVPDLLVCYRGFFIGIEVKRPSTMHTVSKLQKYNLESIRLAGGQAIAACTVTDVEQILNCIDGELDG